LRGQANEGLEQWSQGLWFHKVTPIFQAHSWTLSYIRKLGYKFKLFLSSRAVKTGGPARYGPVHSGFGLSRAGLKSPDKKRAEKVWPGPGPVRASGLAHIFFPFFFKKKTTE
jgi:hypothetical protein